MPRKKAVPVELEPVAIDPKSPHPSIRTAISNQGYIHAISGTDSSKLMPHLTSSSISSIMVDSKLIKSYPKLIPRELAIEQHVEILRALKIPRRKELKPLTIPAYDDSITEDDTKSVIKAVGFEIEGCWRGLDRERAERNEGDSSRATLDFHVVSDGSVNNSGASHMRTIGEVRMGPYPHGNIDVAQVEHQYPDHVNASCGLHVHLSFPNRGLYSSYMCREFYTWFIEGLKQWRLKCEANGEEHSEQFWNRLNGGNRQYCKVSYSSHIDGDRYNAINYCMSKHGTIEVRVLNAWKTPTECLNAVREVMRLFTLWGKQFNLPTDTINYGDDIIANTEMDGSNYPAQIYRGSLLLHPGFKVSKLIYANTNCTDCAGRGWKYYHSCDCREWCPTCQPVRYKAQAIHHSTLCWGTCTWSPNNITCGVPQELLRYVAIMERHNTKPCHFCGVLPKDHMKQPGANCLMGLGSEGYWMGLKLNGVSV